MEYVIHLSALFCIVSCLLKCSFYSRRGIIAAALAWALFAKLVTPLLTELSRTEWESWFASRRQMLDLTVCVVLEASLMLGFCFNKVSPESSSRSGWSARIVRRLLGLYPGLLAGGALCHLSLWLLYSVPGLDFSLFSWMAATITFILFWGGIQLTRFLLNEEEVRLELLFIVNMLLIVLGIIGSGCPT